MAISVTVKHRDGSTTSAEVWASTEVAFEEKFAPLSWGEAFNMNHPRQTFIYFAAFHAISEAGRTSLPFDAWMKTVDAVEINGGDEENPTDPEA